IIGGAARDNIQGGSGDDSMLGMGGDDAFAEEANEGTDVMIGGDGFDQVGYGGSIGLSITLDGLPDDGAPGEHDHVQAAEILTGDGNDRIVCDGGNGKDAAFALSTILLEPAAQVIDLRNYASVENAVGGNANDLIIGTDQDNVLAGGGGNDTILGKGGNDKIEGGSGNDSLSGD